MFYKIILKYKSKNNFNKVTSCLFCLELVCFAVLIIFFKKSNFLILYFLILYIVHMFVINYLYRKLFFKNDVLRLHEIIKENKIIKINDIKILREYIYSKKDVKIKIPWEVWLSLFLSLMISILSEYKEGVDFTSILNEKYSEQMIFIFLFAFILLSISLINYIILIATNKYMKFTNLKLLIDKIYFEKEEEKLNGGKL